MLFDAAGTLIDPAEPVGETYARAAAVQGVALSAWRLGDAFARVLARAPAMAFPEVPFPERPARERDWWRERVREVFRAADSDCLLPDVDACFETLWDHYAAARAWRLRPGVREALAGLRRRGLRTGVVSNFDGRLPGILEGHGLGALLDVVVLAADAGPAKPDPAIFRLALARLGVEAGACAYVGDRPQEDLAGARAAGLVPVDAGGIATLADLPGRIQGRPLADVGEGAAHVEQSDREEGS